MRKLNFGLIVATGLLFGGALSYAASGDISTWKHIFGNNAGKEAARIDSLGGLALGDAASAPSLTDYHGLKVSFYNAGSALTVGDVVVSSNAGTGYGIKSYGSDLKTVLGVADSSIASGAVGQITIVGYAVVHTSGAVAIGDMLVSTSATNGYAWANNSPTTGTVIGRAVSAGVTAGGNTLVLIK